MFRHAGRYRMDYVVFFEAGNGFLIISRFLVFEGVLETLLNGFPAVLNNRLALGFERIPLTGERHGCFVIDMLFSGGAQKTHRNKANDLLLRFRQLGDVLLFKLNGGDNGMVVSNLSVIGDPLDVRRMRQAAKNRHFPTDHLNHLTGSSLHVIGDELTVRARIGQELLFVERLDEIERLLGSKAVIAVCLALQGGQVVELRRIDRLSLLFERRNDGLHFIASRRNRLRFIFGFDLLHISRQTVSMNMGIEVFLFLEGADLTVTLNQHGKRRCLHSTNYQLLVVESGKQPCAVYADNPVSLGTAQSRFI